MHGRTPDRDDSRGEQICPLLVHDAHLWELFPRRGHKEPIHMFGQKETDRYVVIPHRLVDVVSAALAYFDGYHSLHWIEEYLLHTRKARVQIVPLYRTLSEVGLIASPPPHRVRPTDIEAASRQIADIPLPAPSGRVRRLVTVANPPLFVCSAILVVWATVVLCLHGVRASLGIGTNAVGFEGVGHGAACALLIMASIIAHELSHAYAAVLFGLSPRRVRLALYFGVIPFIYLRLGGLYTLRPGQRIVVWLAGIYANIVIASLGVATIYSQMCGHAWAPVLGAVAYANYVIAILNLFPFMPTDGYYVFATLCRTYNVRRAASQVAVHLLLSGDRQNVPAASLLYLVVSSGVLALFVLRRFTTLIHRQHSILQICLVAALIAAPFALDSWNRRSQRKVPGAASLRVVGVLAGLYLSGIADPIVRVLGPYVGEMFRRPAAGSVFNVVFTLLCGVCLCGMELAETDCGIDGLAQTVGVALAVWLSLAAGDAVSSSVLYIALCRIGVATAFAVLLYAWKRAADTCCGPYREGMKGHQLWRFWPSPIRAGPAPAGIAPCLRGDGR